MRRVTVPLSKIRPPRLYIGAVSLQMTDPQSPRTRMTRLTRRWIGTREAKRVALLRAYPACTAQLGQARPQAHAD